MNFSSRSVFFVLMIVLVVIVSYFVLNTREHRTVGDKVNAAVRELQDRTPAEKIQDQINDAKGK